MPNDYVPQMEGLTKELRDFTAGTDLPLRRDGGGPPRRGRAWSGDRQIPNSALEVNREKLKTYFGV
jgi:hypothetical protein